MKNGKITDNIKPDLSLRWTENREDETSVFPPAVCLIGETYYQISCFDNPAESYYVIDAQDFKEALNLSANIAGEKSITLPELSNLAIVSLNNGVAPLELDVFISRGIKGKQNLETVKAVKNFSDTVKAYLTSKEIPLKTLAVFVKLDTRSAAYVEKCITEKELSVGDFRKLVNLLFDMSTRITDDDLKGDLMSLLAHRKEEPMADFRQKFSEIVKDIPLTVQSPDSFETGRLTFTFQAETAEEFTAKTGRAAKAEEAVKKLFRFLDEQNIS